MKNLIVLVLFLAACGGETEDNNGNTSNNGDTSNNGIATNNKTTITSTNNVTTTESCGNALLDPGEACDGTIFDNKTCETEGFASGDLKCTEDCTLDISECGSCGNGVVDGDDECEGDDLAGATCASLEEGAGGDLACDNACKFTKDDCLPPILNCRDIDSCIRASCALGSTDATCDDDCFARAPQASIDLHDAIGQCIRDNMCKDNACFLEKCSDVSDACGEDGVIR